MKSSRAQKLVVTISSLIVVATGLSVDASDLISPRVLQGRWRVARVLDYAPTTSITEADAKKLPGNELVISSRRIKFLKRECQTPRWEIKSTSAARFFASYKIAKPTEVSARVTVADPTCRAGARIGPLIVDRQNMLFVWRGALVEVARVN